MAAFKQAYATCLSVIPVKTYPPLSKWCQLLRPGVLFNERANTIMVASVIDNQA